MWIKEQRTMIFYDFTFLPEYSGIYLIFADFYEYETIRDKREMGRFTRKNS